MMKYLQIPLLTVAVLGLLCSTMVVKPAAAFTQAELDAMIFLISTYNCDDNVTATYCGKCGFGCVNEDPDASEPEYHVISFTAPTSRQLGDIPLELGALTWIESLQIVNQGLENIRPIETLTALQELILPNNKFGTTIPDFSSYTANWVDLRNNDLQVGRDLSAYTALETLILESNNFQQLYEYTAPPNLKVLRASNNRLVKMEDIADHPNLIELDLRSNNVQTLQNLWAATGLETLLLSNNHLTEFPQVETLDNLQQLRLEHNYILTIPEAVCAATLPSLTDINIDYNYLDCSTICPNHPSSPFVTLCDQTKQYTCSDMTTESDCEVEAAPCAWFELEEGTGCYEAVPSCQVHSGPGECVACELGYELVGTEACVACEAGFFSLTGQECVQCNLCTDEHCDSQLGCTECAYEHTILDDRTGRCSCASPYGGETCDILVCAPVCAETGTCTLDEDDLTKAGCVCEEGFEGANCATEVVSGTYSLLQFLLM